MLATVLPVLVLLLASAIAHPQTLYKYRGTDGEWIYTDRPPADASTAEMRNLGPRTRKSTVSVGHRIVGRYLEFVARNAFHAPMEVSLIFDDLRGLAQPDPDQPLSWLIPSQGQAVLLRLAIMADGAAPQPGYRYWYVAGDPAAEHRPAEPYRAPYAIASNFRITQAYPDVVTHMGADSWHAVDIAMPIGTDVFAAREGVVFDIARSHYRNGLDPVRDLHAANFIRILHDDGTYALYAHLHWDSIRVKPGERVERGQYIADSGNTGFSTGPHLHFAVMRNTGGKPESLPVEFASADQGPVVPASGNMLTAY